MSLLMGSQTKTCERKSIGTSDPDNRKTGCLKENKKTLLWTLGVKGQRDVAEVADVTGGGLGGDGLALAAVLVRSGLQDQALLLGLDLLGGGGSQHRAVLVQFILEPLDQLVLLIQLQLQLIDQGVALPELLDLQLQGVLQVPQGAHWTAHTGQGNVSVRLWSSICFSEFSSLQICRPLTQELTGPLVLLLAKKTKPQKTFNASEGS